MFFPIGVFRRIVGDERSSGKNGDNETRIFYYVTHKYCAWRNERRVERRVKYRVNYRGDEASKKRGFLWKTI